MMHVINTKYHFTQLQYYSIPMYVCIYVCMYVCMYVSMYVIPFLQVIKKECIYTFTRVGLIGALKKHIGSLPIYFVTYIIS